MRRESKPFYFGVNMLVTLGLWGRVYGLRVRRKDRKLYFVGLKTITVEIEGKNFSFKIMPSFWKRCIEFRDNSRDRAIEKFADARGLLEWEIGAPHHFELTHLQGNLFRLGDVSSESPTEQGA